MLKPYERHKREVDKLMKDIEQEYFVLHIEDVLKHLLINNLSDIVYDSWVYHNKKYKGMLELGNNTRLVIRKFGADVTTEIFSQTGEGVNIGFTKYMTISDYNECMTFDTCRVIMIDINLPYIETKRQVYDILNYTRYSNIVRN